MLNLNSILSIISEVGNIALCLLSEYGAGVKSTS